MNHNKITMTSISFYVTLLSDFKKVMFLELFYCKDTDKIYAFVILFTSPSGKLFIKSQNITENI